MRAFGRLAAASVLLFAAAGAVAFATVIYVNAAATGANNGSSWTNAFTTLPPALTAAGASDEIWVAQATYKPTATSNRTIAFVLKDGVSVYGGFAGNETQRTQRDPDAHVTVLSGDIGAPGVSTDNSYHVVTADATVSNTARLDGFKVTGGQADAGSPNNKGAGLWINGGSPLVAGVLFTGNFALSSGGGAQVDSGAPRFLSCTFDNNSVSGVGTGAGLSSSGGTVNAESSIFRSNTISGAASGGGGLQTVGGTTLLNCVVAENSPDGVQITGNTNVIQDSTFTANGGYGIRLQASTSNTMSNSIVWNNDAGSIFFGGGSTASISYCDVEGGAAGSGNIDADPLFLASPGDLRPGPSSPVVDAGSNSLVPGGTTLDVRGLPRFFDDPDIPDTGVGNVPPGIVDMGAYERIPITVTAPSNLTICSGDSASFSVTATGQPTLTYQWRKNGVNLSNGGAITGVTTSMLSINPASTGDAGDYDLVVTDGFRQSNPSSEATLAGNARPTATAGGGGTICTAESVGITGSGGVSCSWSPGAGLDNASSCTPTASPTITTVYSLTVTAANGCVSTNVSTVTVNVNQTPALPVITSPLSVPVGASGASASVVNHPGSTWDWTLSGGVITAGQGSRQIIFDAASPGTTMHCTVTESATGCISPEASRNIQVDFLDMPPTNGFHDYVNTIARNGITAGCSNGNYCGTANVNRSQMAVFLMKAKHGAAYVPPSCNGMFTDVACPSAFADWIEELAVEGITGGCGATTYCPTNPVTRAQMAVFLLKASIDPAYAPPPASGTIFTDVPAGAFAAAWIEDLFTRGITGGCLTNPLRYCPNNTNNRQQMAVFLVKSFNLQ